ncbi:hypothetical protein MI353_15095 [Alteromonas sp. MCA-1]|uniref:major coat protein n=1 Tax=Alteromonas sp. MCA-1 TaxID=2917731 RepID=UPI001EF90CC0|nr:major coat protein [Alteromonas sp. MCA-1]MCG7814073.1 hypothetical protein [Alteromonas sp. MCA-1]
MDNKTRYTKTAPVLAGSVIAMGIIANSAQAAVPEALTSAITSVSTDATSLMDSATPVVFGIAAAFVLWKIGKRVLGKI